MKFKNFFRDNNSIKIIENEKEKKYEKFENFELFLEWKISEGGNSGIFYHLNEGFGDTIAPEYQLIDDLKWSDYNNNNKLEEWQKTGADYAMHTPDTTKKITKPAFINRKLCINDIDFCTLDNINEIKLYNFFSFKDEDGYIYGFDSGFGFKPGTGMQKEFLRETSLLANEVIMVGDSMADIESGNKIGMTTVAVLTGPLGRSELEKKADIVLNSISEIPSLLQKL